MGLWLVLLLKAFVPGAASSRCDGLVGREARRAKLDNVPLGAALCQTWLTTRKLRLLKRLSRIGPFPEKLQCDFLQTASREQ